MGVVVDHQSDTLLAYVERRLQRDEAARMDAHLRTCAACRRQAAELAPVVEALAAMPVALRRVPGRARDQWPAVWNRVLAGGRVQRDARKLFPAAGRLAPRVTVYLSLLVVALTATMAWPGGMAGPGGGVTAGVVETPRAAAVTPGAATLGAEAAGVTTRPAAATAGLLAVPVGPAPAGTPTPGEGG
jgi:hypothetical protein